MLVSPVPTIVLPNTSLIFLSPVHRCRKDTGSIVNRGVKFFNLFKQPNGKRDHEESEPTTPVLLSGRVEFLAWRFLVSTVPLSFIILLSVSTQREMARAGNKSRGKVSKPYDTKDGRNWARTKQTLDEMCMGWDRSTGIMVQTSVAGRT
ncbi:hypothetical protein RRG08_026778 [Elysia crispata]|uniref:Uncharacterized protein n=1 Tax=Elysia crispata TaxID=231223 RepID=A0AAE1AQK1_9GAST|nr:hypothetical protein RRG08_026778 [Elysia crispata]